MAASSLRADMPDTSAPGTRTDDVRRTAARLFAASGYSATTVNDIADAVGILPGSLYHHFGSKEEIALDLLDRYDRALDALGQQMAERWSNDPGDPEAFVRTLAASQAELSFDHQAAVRLRTNTAPPSVSTDRFTVAMRASSPTLERVWRSAARALPTTFSRPVDRTLLAFLLSRLSPLVSIHFSDPDSAATVADQLCDMVMRGVARDAAGEADLDRSAPFRAASSVIAAWQAEQQAGPASERDKTLVAARSEFAKRGYEATTIRDVAVASGVRMGTLYRQISSKESLIREIIDSYAERIETAFATVLSADGSPLELLDGLARLNVHASRRFREEEQIVLHGWTQRESSASPLHDYFRGTQARLSRIEELLGRGVRAGSFELTGDTRTAGLHLRTILWTPYHESGRTSETSAFAFVRHVLMRGATAR